LTRPNDRDHILMVLLWCQSSKWLVVWAMYNSCLYLGLFLFDVARNSLEIVADGI
jgi:hypothetical protein